MRLGYLSALAAIALSIAPAHADQLPTLPQAQVVSDDALAQIRGMYVPPSQEKAVTTALIVRDASGATPLNVTQNGALMREAGADPLSGISGGRGTVTYFGVDMVSTWTQSGTSGTQGVSAGLDIGFDLAHGQVTIGKWSSSTNGGLPTTAPTGSIAGSGASNLSSGVGQNIQVSGNGNTIDNTAVVTVGSVGAAVLVPTTNTCGAQCTITVGRNGAAVGISTPQGSVLQMIGPNGILQSAQVSSDMNTITNQLGVHVQMNGSPSFSAGSLLPILQTLNGLP